MSRLSSMCGKTKVDFNNQICYIICTTRFNIYNCIFSMIWYREVQYEIPILKVIPNLFSTFNVFLFLAILD